MFQAHGLLYHLTLGLRLTKRKKIPVVVIAGGSRLVTRGWTPASGIKFEGGFGFQISGFDFGFRVSGFGFRVSGFGFRFRVSGFGFRVSVSGFGFRILGSGFRFSNLSFGFRVSGFGFGFGV